MAVGAKRGIFGPIDPLPLFEACHQQCCSGIRLGSAPLQPQLLLAANGERLVSRKGIMTKPRESGWSNVSRTCC
jgi:hypothetical protein